MKKRRKWRKAKQKEDDEVKKVKVKELEKGEKVARER